MAKTDLFGDFETISPKKWKHKIQYELQGADYAKTLLWESLEGITVKPFYTLEDVAQGTSLPKHTPRKPWLIGQNIYAGNAKMANKKAVDALERGAQSILFDLPTEDIPLKTLLQNIAESTVPVHCHPQFLPETDYLSGLKNKSNLSFYLDSIGQLAKSGNWYLNEKKDLERLATFLEQDQNIEIAVSADLYQNAGANRAQQLAYAIAHAHEYIYFLESKNLKGTCKRITFKVAMDSTYFFEIAKIWALRHLWDTLAKEYGLEWECHILVTPTKRNKTIYSYNTNMLRTTTECMAAVLGGADTIVNMPYDALYHKDNEFAERIARNQLLTLQHESHFNKVSNPAEGAYFIEILTQQLAEKALELFKSIEKGGGFLKQLKTHTLQKKIKESAAKEQALFDTQKEILVGTNAYELETELMKANLELFPFVKTHSRKTLIEPILERRLAEALEQKRLRHE